MAWHRQRAPELNDVLDASSVEMTSISSTAPVPDVARTVWAACGWVPQCSNSDPRDGPHEQTPGPADVVTGC